MAGRTYTLNPIVQREMRGRWRKLAAPITVFLVAGLLAYICYQTWAYLATQTKFQVGPGRDLVRDVLLWQSAFLCLITPLICCGAISSERQKGMLSGLVVTSLSPGQIVQGKWLSALVYHAVILLIPLPIFMKGLILGGVAPLDILLCFIMQMAQASLGCMLGICASAWCSTTSRAALLSLALSLFHLISASIVQSGAEAFAGSIHPAFTVLMVMGNRVNDSQPFAALGCLSVTSILTWVLYDAAKQALVEQPVEPHTISQFQHTSPNLRHRHQPSKSSKAERPLHRSRVENLPATSPIALRDLRVNFRWAEKEGAARVPFFSWRIQLFVAALMSVMAVPGGHMFYAWTGSAGRFSGLGQFREFLTSKTPFYWMVLVGLTLCAGLLSASSFSREKERGTLRDLTITPLSSWEILFGFAEGAIWIVLSGIPFAWLLIVVALFTYGLWPVLIACFAFACLLALYCTLGLLASWFTKHTAAAIALLVTFAVVHLAWGVTYVRPDDYRSPLTSTTLGFRAFQRFFLTSAHNSDPEIHLRLLFFSVPLMVSSIVLAAMMTIHLDHWRRS